MYLHERDINVLFGVMCMFVLCSPQAALDILVQKILHNILNHARMRTTIRNFYIICMATYLYGLPTGARQGVDASCSRALEAVRSIRKR